MKKFLLLIFTGLLMNSCALVLPPGVLSEFVDSTGANAFTVKIIDASASGTWDHDFDEAIEYSGKLYFEGRDSGNSRLMFEYDGKSISVIPSQGAYEDQFYDPVIYNGKLYFKGRNTNSVEKVFCYDGNTVSKLLTVEMTYSNGFQYGIVYQDQLFFLGYDTNNTSRMFKFNDTEGIVMIQAGSYYNGFRDPVILNEKLFFEGVVTSRYQNEILSYDGTNITNYYTGGDYNFNMSSPQIIGDRIIFQAFNSSSQEELFVYESGAVSRIDMSSVNYSNRFSYRAILNGDLYFQGRENFSGEKHLFKIDASLNPSKIGTSLSDYDYEAQDMFAYHGKIYFMGLSSTFDDEFGANAYKAYYYDGALIRGVSVNNAPDYRWAFLSPILLNDKVIFHGMIGLTGAYPQMAPFYIDDDGISELNEHENYQLLNITDIDKDMIKYGDSVIFPGLYTNSSGVTNFRLYQVY